MLLTSLLLITLLPSCDSDEVPSPHNLSVSWKSDFEPEFSWTAPKSSCEFRATLENIERDSGEEDVLPGPPFTSYIAMRGGKLYFSVSAICNTTKSKPSQLNVTYPDLVKDLKCIVSSSNRTKCSWQRSRAGGDLAFFYRSVISDKQGLDPLRECPSYTTDGGGKTGCDLSLEVFHALHILLNSTGEDGAVIRNTYIFSLLNVSLAPLKMSVKMQEDKLNISWTTPDVFNLNFWKFNLSYTECDEVKMKQVKETDSLEMRRITHCPYRLSVRAESFRGNSGWSEPVFLDADFNPLVFLVIVPVLVSALVLLTLVCLRKHKDAILPKVPEPTNLLDGNRNVVKVRDLFISTEDERISDLVIVQQSKTTLLNS